jgi:NitT/TauT family transport system substrate-binding protein
VRTSLYASRREFLTYTALATAGGLLGGVGIASTQAADLETRRIRLIHDPSICVAPQYLAEGLLRTEGFTDVQYVEATDGFGTKLIAAGDADVMLDFAGVFLTRIDAGDPLLVLGGVHVGCFELFGGAGVRAVRDLKGKRVAVLADGAPEHIFMSSVVAYVGLDPQRDVHWQAHSPEDSMRLLAEGKVDAYAGFPPVPQELRARKIGHLVLNTSVDRPWSQYFCCVVGTNRDFARRHPVATKSVLRAILRSADICAADPDRAARFIATRGYTGASEYAAQAMREIPYARWRDYNPEDTVRFYALRLHEAGMIKANPNRIVAQGTDWSFFKALRAEL